MPWLTLILAGCFEIGFTTFMKLSEGFSRLWPTVGFLVTAVVSFLLLNHAARTIPTGTAYAVWTGIGAFGTAIVGMVFFKDPVTPGRLLFLTTLIGSVIGLKLVSAN
jgi:quaternary ammonium compound-resistance protein SugE